MTFDALAPILLVHGINANSSWFDTFKMPFDTLKVPYQALGPRKAFGLGPGTIQGVAQHTLPIAVQQAAQAFGAKHIHVIAHSKGGLWSRVLLSEAMPAGIGVYSLTTLDTPHRGSVGADIRRHMLLQTAEQFSRIRFLLGRS